MMMALPALTTYLASWFQAESRCLPNLEKTLAPFSRSAHASRMGRSR
jgi:hypothetical protein